MVGYCTSLATDTGDPTCNSVGDGRREASGEEPKELLAQQRATPKGRFGYRVPLRVIACPSRACTWVLDRG
jgi:hypothetical protein